MSADKNKDNARLSVKITPNAGRNEIVGVKDGVLQVKIAAPPDKGKANKELIDFLAERLQVRKSDVLIIKGQTGRHKTIIIEGMSEEEALKRISI
ncbi:MAG: DUF167 domain-containing protein [Dehalococcoidales bacterium]